jgi:hypothetical protein
VVALLLLAVITPAWLLRGCAATRSSSGDRRVIVG